MADIPPPPAGYEMQPTASAMPTPPPGYVMQGEQPAAPEHPSLSQFTGGKLWGGNFADAMSHHIDNIGVGLAQDAAHGLGQVVDAGASTAPTGSIGSKAAQWVDSKIAQLDQSIRHREANYQATVPNSPSSYAGAIAGEVLPWATGLGEARAIGAIPEATTTAAKIASLALEGGTMGAAQPVTGDGSYGNQKALQVGTGAAAGPAMYGVGSVLGRLGSGAQSVLQHIRNPQAIADAEIAARLGTDPATLAKLQAAKSFVPGETVPATQAIATPDSVQLDRLLRNHPDAGKAFVSGDLTNDAARRGVIQSIAQDDVAMQAAKQARTEAIQPFIDQNLTDSRPIARWNNAQSPFQSILDNPGRLPSADFNALQQANKVVQSVRSGALQEDDGLQALQQLHDSVTTKKAQDAFTQAQGAINKNMVDPSGVLKAIKTIRNGPLGVDPRRAADLDALTGAIQNGTNINGHIGTDMLDAVRQNASKMLGNATPQSALAYGPAKNQIVDALERVIPGYRDYVATYAKHSQPINDMEAGSSVLAAIDSGGLNAGGDPRAAIPHLRSALKADDNAHYPMSPEARGKMESVLKSLQSRSIVNNKAGAAGPGTASDLLSANQPKTGSLIFGDPLAGKPGTLTRMVGTGTGGSVGALLGGGIPGAVIGSSIGSLLPEAVGRVNSGIASRIGNTVADSGKTAEAIQRYLSTQKKAPSTLDKMLDPVRGYLYGTKPIPRIKAKP